MNIGEVFRNADFSFLQVLPPPRLPKYVFDDQLEPRPCPQSGSNAPSLLRLHQDDEESLGTSNHNEATQGKLQVSNKQPIDFKVKVCSGRTQRDII